MEPRKRHPNYRRDPYAVKFPEGNYCTGYYNFAWDGNPVFKSIGRNPLAKNAQRMPLHIAQAVARVNGGKVVSL